jgi:hypothetical protein
MGRVLFEIGRAEKAKVCEILKDSEGSTFEAGDLVNLSCIIRLTTIR